jgi:hypothetical protein
MDYDDEGDGDVDSEDVGPAPKISVTAYAEDSEVPESATGPIALARPKRGSEREQRGNVGMASEGASIASLWRRGKRRVQDQPAVTSRSGHSSRCLPPMKQLRASSAMDAWIRVASPATRKAVLTPRRRAPCQPDRAPLAIRPRACLSHRRLRSHSRAGAVCPRP